MDRFEEIENFLTGKMPSSEREIFKKEIIGNPELKSEVEMQRLERTAVKMFVEDDLRSKMKAILTEEKPFVAMVSEGNKSTRRFKRWISVAATIAILLLMGIFFWQSQPSVSDIIAEGYELVKPDNYSGEKREINLEPLTEDARAIDSLLFLAHTSMFEGDYTKALSLFIERESTANTILKQKISYYKALAFFGNGEEENARKIFRQLIENNSRYQADAAKMLERIERYK